MWISTPSSRCKSKPSWAERWPSLDLFSGGALTSVAVFALGIMPYITASIIMQLLAAVIPKLEEWQNEGQVGQKKITQWTR
jgi:preprotein translocase subunit SecY